MGAIRNTRPNLEGRAGKSAKLVGSLGAVRVRRVEVGPCITLIEDCGASGRDVSFTAPSPKLPNLGFLCTRVFGTFPSVYDIRRLSTDREVEDGDDDQIVRSSAYFDTDPVNSNRPLIGPRLQTVML